MRGVHSTLSKRLLAFPRTYARSSCRGGRSSRRPHGRPRIWRHDVSQRQYMEDGRIRVVEWLVPAVHVEIGPAQTGQFDSDDRVVGFLDPAWEGIGRAPLSVAAAWWCAHVGDATRSTWMSWDGGWRRVARWVLLLSDWPCDITGDIRGYKGVEPASKVVCAFDLYSQIRPGL
jgi:hypothetical protein